MDFIYIFAIIIMILLLCASIYNYHNGGGTYGV